MNLFVIYRPWRIQLDFPKNGHLGRTYTSLRSSEYADADSPLAPRACPRCSEMSESEIEMYVRM